MENLEEKVASALLMSHSHNGSIKFEELLQLMTELERKAETGEITRDLEVLKKLFGALDDYIGRARPVISPLQNLELDPVFAKCLTCLTHIIVCNNESQDYVREGTCILESLTSALNDKYNVEHQKVILKTIEILSRTLKVLWPLPYLSNLIRNLFGKLLIKPQSTIVFNYCLQILTNLVFRSSSCCLNIAARDPNYWEVIKMFLTMMATKDTDSEQLVLLNHLVYLMKPSVDVKTGLMAKHFNAAFVNMIKKLSDKRGLVQQQEQLLPQNHDEYLLHSYASSFFYLSLCLETIFSRIGMEHKDEFLQLETAMSQNYGVSVGRNLVNELAKEISRRIVTNFEAFRTFITSEKPQMIAESLLGMLKSTFPQDFPLSLYDTDTIESLIMAIDSLAKTVTPQSNSHLVTLETYNHFFDRIFEAKSRTITDQAFHNSFKVCKIVPASSSQDLLRNVATIRLLTHFTHLTAFNDLIKEHLDENLLLRLVECLLVDKPETYKPPSLLSSVCLVEGLNGLSMISKCSTKVMKIIQKEETLTHIANCIVNGDETLIYKGLSLTGNVGFIPKCRSDLSKIIFTMKESTIQQGSSVGITNEYLVNMSDNARFGLKKLNTNLEMFMRTYESNDCAVDDIISWHKIKSDLHDVEVASMRDQIFQLGRTIAQYKVLINKQSELITKRAASTAIAEHEHHNLKQMVESMNAKKIELEIKHAKTTDALRKQLSYQEELFKKKNDRLEKMEVQIIQLKEEIKNLKVAKDVVTQSATQLTTKKAEVQKQLEEVEVELKTSKHRITTLEKDLKKSEESREATENLLENERRKTEIIQQVLSSRQ